MLLVAAKALGSVTLCQFLQGLVRLPLALGIRLAVSPWRRTKKRPEERSSGLIQL